jgi:NTP pyrophosphatase (non-canonical NTP hydrolase)
MQNNIQPSGYRAMVLGNCPNFATDPMREKLSLAGLGVAGEAGEVADLIKKINHHEVPLEEVFDKLVKEMGDVYWYLEYLGATLGVTTEYVMQMNINKLRARHPNGWTPQSQQAKRDEANDAVIP